MVGKERNVGLDVCRILSMVGIVLLHVVNVGGVLPDGTKATSVSYWVSDWVVICAFCSVDIFAMMSGYLGINKSRSTCFRSVELIAVVLFYSVLITAAFLIFMPGKITGIKDIVKGIFPPLVGRYWYITCFIPVLILQPFVNKMLLCLSKKQHGILVALQVLIFSCLPSVIPVDFFCFAQGYSFVWLLSLYTIGAYLGRIKEDGKFKFLKKYAALIFFAVSFVLLFGNILVTHVVGKNHNYMVCYTSPLVLLMGVCVLLSLADKKWKAHGKALEKVSAVTFDVYIIHGHVLIYDTILAGAFAWIYDLAWYWIPAVCVGCAIAIFAVCTLVGLVRAALFRLVRAEKGFAKLAAKVDRVIYTVV